MVTREYPVEGADRSQIERAHRDGRVKRLRDVRPDLPSEFIQAVERALSPDPAARPQTAGELEAALTRRSPTPVSWTWCPARRGGRRGSPPRGDPGRVDPRQTVATTPAPTSFRRRPPSRRRRPPRPRRPPILPITVRAKLFRTRNGVETPLTADISLVGGDQLSMQIESSIAVYVYVINADDAGKTYRLFPLPDVQPDNPLAAAKIHRLPARTRTGSVTSEGGREHFVDRGDAGSERGCRSRRQNHHAGDGGRGPRDRIGHPSAQTIGVLRSVGGLVKTKTTATASAPSLLWYDRPATSRDNARPRAAPGCAG